MGGASTLGRSMILISQEAGIRIGSKVVGGLGMLKAGGLWSPEQLVM
jgi:hypothetical protein